MRRRKVTRKPRTRSKRQMRLIKRQRLSRRRRSRQNTRRRLRGAGPFTKLRQRVHGVLGRDDCDLPGMESWRKTDCLNQRKQEAYHKGVAAERVKGIEKGKGYK